MNYSQGMWLLDQFQAGADSRLPTCSACEFEQPELCSPPQLAEQLSARLARAVNAGWVRQNLHRACDLFVESLVW